MRQRLWTPLSSAVFRRLLSPSSSYDSTNSAVKTHSPAFFSPSPATNSERYTIFPSHGFYFLGKCFLCTQSALNFDAKCWNCNAGAEAALFLVCPSCRCIQPVDHSVDYFQIFGLEKRYDIEENNLEGKYKNWQKKLHPDLVHSKSEKEREYAADQSARVIDAYRTLSKPLSRAIYILRLEGVDVDDEETISESELLEEILEIRQAVEEAADSQALNQIRSQMEENLKQWSNSFANAFRDQNFGEAVKCIRRMKYYGRVVEEIVKRL
ncbi:hypothetical protein UlMin_005355 [Ulmus minor]